MFKRCSGSSESSEENTENQEESSESSEENNDDGGESSEENSEDSGENSEENSGWTTDTDPRKTKFGSFIRKFSLDELPQFFNVLSGEMSLVGPRPELPFFVEQFKEEIPLYLVRQQVRPGITGWAQVNGYRGDTSIAERIRHDIWYIENWTLWLDVKILFMTVFGGMMNSEKLKK